MNNNIYFFELYCLGTENLFHARKNYFICILNSSPVGSISAGGIPMAVGVTADMCTPALSRFGSHELRMQYLAPTIAGDYVGCLGVSEAAAGSDVASIKTQAKKKGGWIYIYLECNK